MTLLHLASALGYSKLVNTMLTWRAENSSMILETEIDAFSQDVDGFTPLVSNHFLSNFFSEAYICTFCLRGTFPYNIYLFHYNRCGLARRVIWKRQLYYTDGIIMQ